MSDVKQYLEDLFSGRQLAVVPDRTALFEKFVQEAANIRAVEQILEFHHMLITNWNLQNRIADIAQQNVQIPNAVVGKPYKETIDLKKLGWEDVVHIEITGLEAAGLQYDAESATIEGVPTTSGDIKLVAHFRMQDEPADAALHEKAITLIINPDPKTLWKNLPSDKEDPFWKEDEMQLSAMLGDRRLVAVSKRGRSHANAGAFRDDDVAYKQLDDTGWNLVVVADGAGSARYAREGSRIACEAVVSFFSANLSMLTDTGFDAILAAYKLEATEEIQNKLSLFVYDTLSKAAYYVHQQIAEASVKAAAEIKDFHTTLIFTLFRKFEAGTAFLCFGVGDCPIALLNKNTDEVTLMNWMDVGEFGGGTRFITMPDIFKSNKFSARFRFKLADDFSYLFMMTDGVYDAKFVVESNLEKVEKWREFLADLQGNNEANTMVDLQRENQALPQQLSAWMEFWSPGNHDDRTLAIVF